MEMSFCRHCEKRQVTETDFCAGCHSQLEKRSLTAFEQAMLDCLSDSEEIPQEAAPDFMCIVVDAISNLRLPKLYDLQAHVSRAIAMRK